MNINWFTYAGGFAFLTIAAASYLAPRIDRRIPYEQTKSCYAGGLSQCDAYFAKVPANKRLVVEQATATVETNTALQSVKFYGSNIQDVALKLKRVGGGNKVYTASQRLMAHLNAGESPNFAVDIASGAAEFSSTTMTLKGYLVDVKR